MGQYYKFINLDKKQALTSWAFDCGAKLMEFSYINNIKEPITSNMFVGALCYLLNNDWAGDRVMVVGDYAMFSKEPSEDGDFRADSAEIWEEPLKELTKDIPEVGTVATEDTDDFSKGYTITMYSYASAYFEELEPDNKIFGGINTAEYEIPRYLCFPANDVFIDLLKLEPESSGSDVDGDWNMTIMPLTLLLALGNEQGGGDYYGPNKDYVGTWALHSDSIFFSDERPDGLAEWNPEFTERELREGL